MPNVDKIFAGIFGLIFVYLLFNSSNVSGVTSSLASSGVNLIKALQARN